MPSWRKRERGCWVCTAKVNHFTSALIYLLQLVHMDKAPEGSRSARASAAPWYVSKFHFKSGTRQERQHMRASAAQGGHFFCFFFFLFRNFPESQKHPGAGQRVLAAKKVLSHLLLANTGRADELIPAERVKVAPERSRAGTDVSSRGLGMRNKTPLASFLS